MKVCESCGAPLPVESNWRRRFCDACKERRNRQSQACNYQRRKGEASAMPVCRECGAGVASWHMRYCESCHKKHRYERMKTWQNAHPDRVRALERKYYRSNPNRRRKGRKADPAYYRRWYAANKARLAAKRKAKRDQQQF